MVDIESVCERPRLVISKSVLLNFDSMAAIQQSNRKCLVAACIISRLGSSLSLLREIDGELDAVLRYEVKTVESQTV